MNGLLAGPLNDAAGPDAVPADLANFVQQVRTGGRSMQTGGVRQPHPHLLAHAFQMTGFT
jgi:hypothetical protein